MQIRLNGEVVDAEAYSLSYPSDILDGILIDVGENYIFLSDHVEHHRELMEDIEELEHFDMSDCEIDYDAAPHCWVVKSVGNMVVHTAEKITEEAG